MNGRGQVKDIKARVAFMFLLVSSRWILYNVFKRGKNIRKFPFLVGNIFVKNYVIKEKEIR